MVVGFMIINAGNLPIRNVIRLNVSQLLVNILFVLLIINYLS